MPERRVNVTPGRVDRVRLDPAGPFKRDPPAPHAMRDRFTSVNDLIVLCHFGVPRIERSGWSLTIDGLVERPVTLGFEDLLRYPRVEVATVHQCCGSPFEPLVPTRRVGNVRWAGARLADVLEDRRPAPPARYLWSFGADSGVFGGVDADAYAKDLPLDRVREDVLICYELNGKALPAEHGYPVRLVVPGFYGTNSVKWLTRMVVADRRAPGPFTTKWYQDPPFVGGGQSSGAPTPVWEIAPESLIVSPSATEPVATFAETEVWGWAWADGGVSKVDVRIGDAPWRQAQLEPRRGWQWQRFSLRWTPTEPGTVELMARAASVGGALQPMTHRRNAVHRVSVLRRHSACAD